MAVPTDAYEPERFAALDNGKVTRPEDLLEEWGVARGRTLKVHLDDGTTRLVPLDPNEEAPRKHPFVARHEWFAPTREYVGASGIRQEERYADIDTAIEVVRAASRERGN